MTRLTLNFADRLIQDTAEARLEVARLLRIHRPRYVFSTKGSGVHPDHQAVTDIVVNGVFYARLPKWDEVSGAPGVIEGTEPHEIDRLFFAHCRMEPAWSSVDFTVDISDWYERNRNGFHESAVRVIMEIPAALRIHFSPCGSYK